MVLTIVIRLSIIMTISLASTKLIGQTRVTHIVIVIVVSQVAHILLILLRVVPADIIIAQILHVSTVVIRLEHVSSS